MNCAGKVMPRSPRKLAKYPDHPTATVEADTIYSSTRFHPMNHAMNRPIVA